VDALLLAAVLRRACVFVRLLQADPKGVLLVCELVNEIAGVGPERKVRLFGGSVVEGRAVAVPVVVVEQAGRVGVARACRRREGMEGNVSRPPGIVRRNLEEKSGLKTSPGSAIVEEAAAARHQARISKERIGGGSGQLGMHLSIWD
jgi:hypothetical protein